MSFILPPEAVSQLSYLQWGNWIAASSTALFFWDWLLCLDREILYIWKTRMSLGKVLFLLHRYPMMALCIAGLYGTLRSSLTVMTPTVCRRYDDLTGLGGITLMAVIQATLMVRVYALYHKSLRIFILLSVVFVTSNVASFCLYMHLRTFIYYESNPLAPYTNFCNRRCPDCGRWFVFVYLPMFIADTLILGLTVSQAYVSAPHRNAAPTLTILFRDGILNFSAIFAVMFFNILFLSLAPAVMSSWFLPYIRPIASSMATRLLLNLHGQIHLTTHTWFPDISDAGSSFQAGHQSVSVAIFARTSQLRRARIEDGLDDVEMKIMQEGTGAERASLYRNSRHFAPVEVYVSETKIVHHEVALPPRKSL